MPFDHLSAYIRDADCQRRDEEIERRKALYRRAKGAASALRSLTDRQRHGKLTRADGMILSIMVLQNLRACTRRERFYIPSRAKLAAKSGYSERTVSQSLARLKEAGSRRDGLRDLGGNFASRQRCRSPPDAAPSASAGA